MLSSSWCWDSPSLAQQYKSWRAGSPTLRVHLRSHTHLPALRLSHRIGCTRRPFVVKCERHRPGPDREGFNCDSRPFPGRSSFEANTQRHSEEGNGVLGWFQRKLSRFAALCLLLVVGVAFSPSARAKPTVSPQSTSIVVDQDTKPTKSTKSKAATAAAAAASTATDAEEGRYAEYAKSVVYSPAAVPDEAAPEVEDVATLWRVEKFKEMTYTQFWNLIGERQVDTVEFSGDRRSVLVTTKPTAPGGVRTERVGLPYDPELYDYMILNGVYVKAQEINHIQVMGAAFVRALFPLFLAWLLVKSAFRIGRKGPKRDELFGGIAMERVDAGKGRISFADVAGIDQVKEEIMEIVTFLRNPSIFLEMGARSPAGILLVGPPGTGKTLLAKAVAGEAGVPFFSVAGTEFMEMFVGVGAARVRDMFVKARKAAPCILFIDEFDGLGKARSFSAMGDDESVHTINQLLTEMDGFEDNTGVVVMAATNRPAALDEALIRPGRFDRIIHLPLPNLQGRLGIIAVHSRDKTLAEDVDMNKVARATAGFTGAELMNLMNISAIMSVRQGHGEIQESDIFDALEKIQREKYGQQTSNQQYEEDIVPPLMRKTIAVYEAAKALIGYITPLYDEIGKVSICPGGLPTGYTYFIPMEENLESRVVTRGFMESKMVVGMAGRCAEKLVMGEAAITTAGAADLEMVNNIAREMVYRCGFSKKLGPVALADNEEVYINRQNRRRAIADIGTELARIGLSEVQELIEGAEAKAYFGLASNYEALEALYTALLEKESLTGEQVAAILDKAGVQKFPDPFVEGFGWYQNGQMKFPGSSELERLPEEVQAANNGKSMSSKWHPLNPYQVRFDIPDLMTDIF